MARLIVADSGPINYLILIECIDVLPTLFEKVVLPEPVYAELSSPSAPLSVQSWMAALPDWLNVREASIEPDPLPRGIHAGELAAISLAMALQADLLLMDDRKGVILARSKGLRVTGTLGILELAASKGLTDLPLAVERLRQANFRGPNTLLDALLQRHSNAL